LCVRVLDPADLRRHFAFPEIELDLRLQVGGSCGMMRLSERCRQNKIGGPVLPVRRERAGSLDEYSADPSPMISGQGGKRVFLVSLVPSVHTLG
jgi:hypothetical protein